MNLQHHSDDQSICYISARCLGSPDDFHHLFTLHAKVSGNRIIELHPRQLCRLHFVAVEKLLLLLLGQWNMLGHELVLSDVYNELILVEDLDSHVTHCLHHCCLGKRCEWLLDDEDRLFDLFLVHLFCQNPDGFHTHSLVFFWEEHNQLLVWICFLVNKDNETLTTTALLLNLLPRCLELLLVFFEEGFSHLIASVVQHRVNCFTHSPQLCHLIFVRHFAASGPALSHGSDSRSLLLLG
mmetsp:Transcript_72335/g.172392  ORF Transcript_72335/g.172392 Transcript_72335/m.172392 type:complete len:239 (+) Transcript_72335:153-869(+)